jgi:hypothetical protein
MQKKMKTFSHSILEILINFLSHFQGLQVLISHHWWSFPA